MKAKSHSRTETLLRAQLLDRPGNNTNKPSHHDLGDLMRRTQSNIDAQPHYSDQARALILRRATYECPAVGLEEQLNLNVHRPRYLS